MKTLFIELTTPQHIGLGAEFTFMPGVNEIPAEVWARWCTAGTMKQAVADGVLVLRAIKSLEQLQERDACKMALDTFDNELLTKWRELETRPNVIKAIDAQIAENLPKRPDATTPPENVTPPHSVPQKRASK